VHVICNEVTGKEIIFVHVMLFSCDVLEINADDNIK